jgi:hypothetical protein
MPKIREISSDKLQDYLQAYKAKRRKSTDKSELNFKIKAIEKAIQERSILGIKVKDKKNSKIMAKIKNLFKRKQPKKKIKAEKKKGKG